MKKKVTQISCDYCGTEIEKSTQTVRETVDLDGKQLGVEIKVFSPDNKRFTDDICRDCVFKAAARNADVLDVE